MSSNRRWLWSLLLLLELADFLHHRVGADRAPGLAEGDFAFDVNEKYRAEISRQTHEKCDVKRLWGVPDMTAYVGRVFKLQIPNEAFSGKISLFQIQNNNMKDPLPKWLVVDKYKGLLRGVPGVRDQGSYTLMISAMPYSNVKSKCPAATDVFTIEVKNKKEVTSLSSDVAEQCHNPEDEVVLRIDVDKPIDHISQKQKLTAINNLASFMALDYRSFLIQSHRPSSDGKHEVVVSGVGDKKKKAHKSSTEILLTVGCLEKIWHNHNILIHQLKIQAKDGTISNLIHLPVTSWEVISRRQSPLMRKQRAAGDYEGSADGMDDGYDEEEYNMSGDYSDGEEGEDYDGSEVEQTSSRVHHAPAPVPSESSPPVRAPPEMPHHHHRHHHGEGLSSSDDDEELEEEFEEVPARPPIVVTTAQMTDLYIDGEDPPTTTLIDIYERQLPRLTTTATAEPSSTPETSTSTSSVSSRRPAAAPDGTEEITTLDDVVSHQMEVTTATLPYSSSSSPTRLVTDADSMTTSPTMVVEEFESITPPPVVVASPATQPPNNEDTTTATTTITLNATTTTTTTTTVNANVVQDGDEENSEKDYARSSTENVNEPSRSPTPTYESEISSKSHFEDLSIVPSHYPLPEETEFPKIPPTVGRPIAPIRAIAGELFVFRVPDETFLVTGKPILSLMKSDMSPIDPHNWLQFDTNTREFYGLPMDEDLGKKAYNLVCEDDSGLTVTDNVTVNVHLRPVVNPTVEFSMTIDTPYEIVSRNAFLKRRFVENLHIIFDDKSFSSMRVKSIAPSSSRRNATKVTWYNANLPGDRCPVGEIEQLERLLIENNNISDKVEHIMGGDFPVLGVNFDYLGVCRGRKTLPTLPPTDVYISTTESSSTIFGKTTETIEFTLPANNPPQLQYRTKKMAITAGKYFSYTIPLGLFHDTEDGTNLTLAIYDYDRITNTLKPLKASSWIQFDPHTREVYALPLEEHVSKWSYIIKATDSSGASVNDTLEITVQQHKGSRTVNHEFSMKLRVRKKFHSSIDWQKRILLGLVDLFRDTDMDQITVRHVNATSDPYEFTWTNDTLPKHEDCPRTDIDRLMGILQSSPDGEPSNGLTKAMSDDLIVKSVTWKGIGSCQGPPSTPDTPELPDHTSNFSPMVRNRIKSLKAIAGELFLFKVPADTFFDPESAKSGVPLKLSLSKLDKSLINPNHWLQFDSKNQEFYGLPMDRDKGEKGYQLICEDSAGLTASDSLMVNVQPRASLNSTIEFKMKIETPYQSFAESALLKRKFVENLRNLFDDRNYSFIRIKDISKSEQHTVVSWYNASLPTHRCPEEEIEQLKKVLIEHKTLTDRVINVMGAEFPVVSVSFDDIGACYKGRLLPPIEPVTVVPPPTYNEDASKTVGSSDDYIVTFIVPIVVIVCMIFIASLIACILYRRRRSGKMTVGDEEERQAFRSKGIPVIFQDELDEKPDPSNKTPIIMKEEKPPLLPPPEYKGADSGSPTPSHNPYLPPPPFAASRENTRNNRPKPTPSYRKPPPYVPP